MGKRRNCLGGQVPEAGPGLIGCPTQVGGTGLQGTNKDMRGGQRPTGKEKEARAVILAPEVPCSRDAA